LHVQPSHERPIGALGSARCWNLPDVDTVLVPWGGGGLTCGIAGAVREARPNVRVFACEFAPTAPLRASLDAGAVAEVPYVESFIDGIGAPRTFAEMFDLARTLEIDALVSPLDEVADALRLIAARNHVVVEGAAAVPVAAAISGAAGDGRIVCVVSGGNIDLEKFAALVWPGSNA
jgi:threonine dehydratase